MLLTVQRVRSLLLRVMSDPGASWSLCLLFTVGSSLMFSILVPVRQHHPANEEFLNPSKVYLFYWVPSFPLLIKPDHLSFSNSFKKDKDRYCFWFFTSLLRCSQDQIGKWHVKPLKSSSAEEKVTKEVLVHFYRVHHQWLGSFVMRSTYFF